MKLHCMTIYRWSRWYPKVWPRYFFEDNALEPTEKLGIWECLDWFGFTLAKWRPRSLKRLQKYGVQHWLGYTHGMNGITKNLRGQAHDE